MFTQRPFRNRLVLLSLILVQLCLITSYFLFYKSESRKKLNKIAFLPKVYASDKTNQKTYYTLKDIIDLKKICSKKVFLDFNTSMCFTEGTDIKAMSVIKGINWKCNCLPGWHGPDCGFPEVLFRALLTKKQPVKPKGPVPFERRLIYLFKYDKSSENLADIRIMAFGDIIDLFIVYENGNNHFETLIKNSMFKEWQHKILYIANCTEKNIWKLAESQISNLMGDDYVISSPSNEIPDRSSLIFMKFYENIPEPIYFRLKWSVFGFFWIHPKKTVISGGACTVSYLRNELNNDLNTLTSSKTIATFASKGILLGDLNHTGGWFCEYCASPQDIIEFFTSNSSKQLINWNQIGTDKITHKFIENLIELGLYIDGKSELGRGHRYSDIDFAPPYVINNDFKYDFLLINFYSQNDDYI
ncbi:beta-1,4-mannosyl-glycoprotein 4-beta-N-acetylglucosaminyltransferase [Dendroctonus ponderosae]|uniref:beta-1,4-mannosyl-glycoprotein 4-beta-N-acetylglucosaminyltransferase n=1 Tax=Dendroctonus ponderosae TaxID=77166 RepID=UPI002035C563|nr:beta-1,4-mannosyl-glycoprotein 4-beta-N-acetylglucosaminyltransferase [Dendroctonus ponderosae]KAH1027876.1 hypothetical protein HUJ05_001307 [Dendroctonus ponderosae]